MVPAAHARLSGLSLHGDREDTLAANVCSSSFAASMDLRPMTGCCRRMYRLAASPPCGGSTSLIAPAPPPAPGFCGDGMASVRLLGIDITGSIPLMTLFPSFLLLLHASGPSIIARDNTTVTLGGDLPSPQGIGFRPRSGNRPRLVSLPRVVA